MIAPVLEVEIFSSDQYVDMSVFLLGIVSNL